MKNCFTFLAAVLSLTLFSFLSPVKAAGPAIAGHYLTDGQILIGVTGSAPVANRLVGTSNQITVTQGAEGGNFALSYPNSVIFPGNVQVLGTLTPTGTSYTYNDLTVNFGVNTGTAVITNTGATALTIGGGITAGAGVVAIVGTDGRIPALSSTYLASLSGASLTTLTAANIAAGSLANTVIASSYSVAAAMTSASVSAVGAVSAGTTVAAGTTVTGGTGVIATAGPIRYYPRSIAQLMALTPTLGDSYLCSDCSPVRIATSTGAVLGGFGDAMGLQLD